MDAVVARKRLASAVMHAMTQAGETPMRWGVDDCGLWVGNIIRAVLGYDPCAECRGRYETAIGSRRALGRKGLKGGIQSAARRHGWKRISPALAKPGDVGMVWTMAGKRRVLATVICRAEATCDASAWFVGRNDAGFTACRAKQVVHCWSLLNENTQAPYVPPLAFRTHPLRRSAPEIVNNEPVSGLIGLTALLGSAIGPGITIGGAFFSTGMIGGALISVGASLALNYAASALSNKGGQSPLRFNNTPAQANDPSIRYNQRQAIPSKRIIYGTAQVGGALFFEEVKPPHLYQGFLICAKQISAFRKLWIGTSELSIPSLTGFLATDTILTPSAVAGQPDYPGHLRASLRLGSASQAMDPILDADFASLSSEFRQRGIATAVLRYNFGANQAAYTELWGQSQRPNPLFLVDGVSVYDPRDASQLVDDETTWKWSNNASLVQADYLRQRYGGRIKSGNIDWDKVAQAADYDDEWVPCKDGTLIRRYTIDGLITLNQKPSDVMSSMLTANRGFVLESAGRVWVSSSRPRTSVAAIHDAILTGGIEYRAAKPKRDVINRLKVRFVAPDREYQTADGPILSRIDLQTADGELLEGTLDLPLTLDHRRAQRLQKAFMGSSRLGRQITCMVDVELLGCAADELVGSEVNFDSELFPQANGKYLVANWGFTDSFSSIEVSLIEYDPAIERDFDPATDEQPFVLANLNVS